ncbi:MAG: 16S rRNA processing protein RimM [Armatimonadetes bacterium]|nr:16S rRNA processing protein RimM [Armatimonadota bacterium]
MSGSVPLQTKQDDDPWDIMIGEVVSPFGLNGELKVVPYTDDPERYKLLKEVMLSVPGGPSQVVRVEGERFHQRLVLLKVKGVDSIDEAEAWRRAHVKIRRSQRLPLPEDRFYVDELVGMEIVTDKGASLGAVTQVLPSPANDVYVTPQAMIPAVKEFVLSVNRETRIILVRDVEGLRTGE